MTRRSDPNRSVDELAREEVSEDSKKSAMDFMTALAHSEGFDGAQKAAVKDAGKGKKDGESGTPAGEGKISEQSYRGATYWVWYCDGGIMWSVLAGDASKGGRIVGGAVPAARAAAEKCIDELLGPEKPVTPALGEEGPIAYRGMFYRLRSTSNGYCWSVHTKNGRRGATLPGATYEEAKKAAESYIDGYWVDQQAAFEEAGKDLEKATQALIDMRRRLDPRIESLVALAKAHEQARQTLLSVNPLGSSYKIAGEVERELGAALEATLEGLKGKVLVEAENV